MWEVWAWSLIVWYLAFDLKENTSLLCDNLIGSMDGGIDVGLIGIWKDYLDKLFIIPRNYQIWESLFQPARLKDIKT